VENVFHLTREGGWSSVSLEAMANAIKLKWADNIALHAAPDLELLKVVATDLSVEGSFGFEISGGGLTGANTGTHAAPGSVTVAVKLATGLTGRSNRGRSFYLGLPKESIVNNELATGVALAIQDDYEAFMAWIVESDAEAGLSVVSYCHDNVWRTEGLATYITNVSVDPNLDNQRRRLNGRGT